MTAQATPSLATGETPWHPGAPRSAPTSVHFKSHLADLGWDLRRLLPGSSSSMTQLSGLSNAELHRRGLSRATLACRSLPDACGSNRQLMSRMQKRGATSRPRPNA